MPPLEKTRIFSFAVSLATVDRETPESYAETQSRATNLVDVFKVDTQLASSIKR